MEYWDITSGGVANHPGGGGGGESSSTSFSCGKSDMLEQDRFDLQFLFLSNLLCYVGG